MSGLFFSDHVIITSLYVIIGDNGDLSASRRSVTGSERDRWGKIWIRGQCPAGVFYVLPVYLPIFRNSKKDILGMSFSTYKISVKN